MEHRVNRLSFEVRSTEREHAFRLRGQLRRSWHTVLPILESEFDALAGDGRWLRLERLHLDLGAADADALEGELAARVRAAIQRVLDRQRVPGTSADFVQEGGGERTIGGPATPGRAPGGDDPLEALEQYLLTGRLSWYLPRGTDGIDVARALARDAWPRLAAVCAQRPDLQAWLRWLELVEGADWSVPGLLDIAAQGEPLDLGSHGLGALLKTLLDPQGPIASRHRRHVLTAAMLTLVSSGKSPQGPAAPQPVPIQFRPSAYERRLLETALGEETLAGLPTGSLCAPVPRLGENPGGRRAMPHPFPDHASALVGQARPGVPGVEADESETPAAHVAYAGSILLHPYLARLFSACAIPFEDGSILPQARERAAALLCYAVTGTDREVEFNLELFKVLLGLPRVCPLSVGGDLLGDDDRAEADAMLRSFIEHWSALKGTSIAGLRSAFLQRPGTLKPVEGGYLLAIERTGVDVLLDRIPFSYSLVKLPWMPRPIHVEW